MGGCSQENTTRENALNLAISEALPNDGAVVDELQEEADNEQICIIDNDLRRIITPSGLLLGVGSDKDVHIVPFRMPRYYKGFDLKDLTVRINITNARGDKDAYYPEDQAHNEEFITFSWVVGGYTAIAAGKVTFSICMRLVEDGIVSKEFNTIATKLTVLPGHEIIPGHDDIVEDLVTQIFDWKKDAEDAAEAAGNSEAAASASAESALASQTAAASSESGALQSASNAADSAAGAAGSAASALSYKNASEASAQNALQSAQSAKSDADRTASLMDIANNWSFEISNGDLFFIRPE